mgnify:FL=1
MRTLLRRFRLALTFVGFITVALLGFGLVAYGTYLSLAPQPAVAATILNASTDSLELVTSSTSTLTYSVSYVEYTASVATPAATAGSITTATTTTILAAPAASTQRQVKRLIVRNTGAATNSITLQKDVSATNYPFYGVSLGPSETMLMDSEGVVHVYGSDGLEKVPGTVSIDGRTLTWLKVGATTEAIGLWQGMAKDTGMPGAWVPGTPGVNGDALSCNTTADATIAGAPYLPDPASGNYFLTAGAAGASVAALWGWVDLIWYDTGLTVTTTTAQTITVPTMPNRDLDGTTNGNGWMLGIYVTTATTNASAITNMTASYTDSDGNTGNTATVSSFPATAVAGALIPFQLAAGDRGVRSVESVTLGTSLVTGAVSMVIYRPLAYVPSPVVNVGGSLSNVNMVPTGIKLWNGTCMWPMYLASATTANTVNAVANLTVR